MGKWAIIKIRESWYWCYGDGGTAAGFGERSELDLKHEGYVDTWSRDYHFYTGYLPKNNKVSHDIW